MLKTGYPISADMAHTSSCRARRPMPRARRMTPVARPARPIAAHIAETSRFSSPLSLPAVKVVRSSWQRLADRTLVLALIGTLAWLAWGGR